LSLGLKLIAKSIVAARVIVSTYVPSADSDIEYTWAALLIPRGSKERHH
jgi:hypothetical protein